MFSRLAACLRPPEKGVPDTNYCTLSQPVHGISAPSAPSALERSRSNKAEDAATNDAIITPSDFTNHQETDSSVLGRVRLGETYFASAELLSVKGCLYTENAGGQELLVSFAIQQNLAPDSRNDSAPTRHVNVARRRAFVCETLQAPADDDDAELMLAGCGGPLRTAVTASCSPASGTTLASTCVTGATTSGCSYARPGSGAVDSRLTGAVTAESAFSTASGVAAAGAAACGGLGSSGSGGGNGGGLSLYARGLRCVSGPVVLRPNQQTSMSSPARDQERGQPPAELPVACISGTEFVGPSSTPCFASSQSSKKLFSPTAGAGGGDLGGRLLGCAMAQRNGDIAAALATLSLQQQMQPPLMLGTAGVAHNQQHVLMAAVEELPAGSRTLLHFVQQLYTSQAGPEPATTSGLGPGFNCMEQIRLLTSMALQIARGMEHLHAHGQFHGSLSPGAVFVSPAAPGGGEQPPRAAAATVAAPLVEVGARSDGAPSTPRSAFHAPVCCKIALAGLVNPMERASRLAIHPGEWGPVSYIAPECFAAGSSGGCPSGGSSSGIGGAGGGAMRALSGIASGGVGVSPLLRVDVNAYGALLYHLFNGVAPFHQYHPAQVLVGLASGGLQLQWRPQQSGSRRPPVPDAIRSLVVRCMSHTPVARPTFHEIVQVLECLAQTI